MRGCSFDVGVRSRGNRQEYEKCETKSEDEALGNTKNQKGLEISEKSCHKIRKCISEGERCYFASAHQIAFEGVGIIYEVW